MLGPFSGAMQDSQNLDCILDDSVWQYKWGAGDDQFTRAVYASGATRIRLIRQEAGGIPNTLYHSLGRLGIVPGDKRRRFIQIA